MEENKNKTIGIFVSVFLHALIIFLLFILPGFKSDISGSKEGIEVALGSDVEGGNSGSMADLGSPESTPPPPTQTAGEEVSTDAVTDDQSDSRIVVPKKDKKVTSPEKKKDNQTTKNQTQTNTTPDKKVDQNSMFKKKTGSPNGNPGGDPNSSGYGGNKDGNRGKENGDPNGNPDGTGGGGNGYDVSKPGSHLKGRLAPKITEKMNVEQVGTLVFQITVNRQGKVIAIKRVPPSTITTASQIEQAKARVKALDFGYKADAEEEQVGYYTIVFTRQ